MIMKESIWGKKEFIRGKGKIRSTWGKAARRVSTRQGTRGSPCDHKKSTYHTYNKKESIGGTYI